MTHKALSYISAILLFFTVASGAVLTSTTTSADVVDDVTITVPEACNLSTDQGEGNTYTESMMNGQYKDNIGDTEFTVACNTEDSFAIYAIGYSGDEYGGTTMLSSDTNAGSTNTGQGVSNIPTGTATSGEVSQWAMKLTPVSGTVTPTIDNGYNNFSIVPSTYTKVASIANSMDYSNEAKVKATYSVYISPTQAAASYTGKVKYTVVHPSTAPAPPSPVVTDPGKICYYANATDAAGTMGCQTLTASQTSATLLASNFSRTGYGFAGWTDSFNYATDSNAHFYGPQEDITFTAGQYSGTNKGLSLYAVWVASAGSLQDQNTVSSVCSSLTPAPATGANLSSVSALTDERDNQTYAIARLADGNCWMIENLRLENTAEYNTDGTLAEGYATGFIGLADPEAPWANNSTTANSLYSTTNITGSNQGYRFPRYNHDNTNSRASSPTTNSVAMYSYGNYYTWPAAIADTGNYTTNNQTIANTSICPSGWHLPSGGQAYASGSTTGVNVTGDPSTFREFYNLGYKIMGSNTTAYESNANSGYSYYGTNTTNANGDTATKALRKYPNNFVYSGYVNSGSVNGRGSYGFYWSSTVYNSYYAYTLRLYSSNVYPGTFNGYKYRGWTIRCVAPGA